jgi:WD40 repeat protein
MQLLTNLIGHTDAINSVAFSPDGLLIVSGGDDRAIKIWDANNGRIMMSFDNDHRITRVAFAPDNIRIISCDDYQTIRIWDITTQKLLMEKLLPQISINTTIAISSDNLKFAVGCMDFTFHIYEMATCNLLRIYPGHNGFINHLTFSPCNSKIVSSGRYDRCVNIWDVESGQLLLELNEHTNGICNIVFIKTFDDEINAKIRSLTLQT